MKKKILSKVVILATVMTMIFGMTMGVSAAEVSIPEEGEYTIDVTSSAAMFKVVKAVLTSKDETMTAVITLSGTGYPKLYMGTGEEAVRATENDYINYVEDSEGKYTFEIPVTSLDTEIDVAAYSTKNAIWYDRELTFNSNSLTKLFVASEKVLLGDGTSEDVNIDSDTLSLLSNSEVTFNTAVGTVVFDKAAMEKIVQNAAGSVTFMAKDITKDGKYASAGYDAVIELKIFDSEGNALYTTEAAGKARVTIPYTNEVSSDKVVKVYYITDSSKEEVNATYDAENKSITFEVAHFSEYAITQESNIQNPVDQTTNVDTNAGATVAPQTGDINSKGMIITLFVALIGSAAIIFKNRKALNLK